MYHFGSPFGQPLYWALNQRPDKFALDPYHQFDRGNVFAGLGAFPNTAQYYDSSLQGNAGTLTNMEPETDWGHGIGRRCVSLGGTNEWIDFGTSNVYNLTDNFSFSVWINPTYSSYAGIIGRTPGTGGWGFVFNGDSWPAFIRWNIGTFDYLLPDARPAASIWTHYHCEVVGGVSRMFVNGKVQADTDSAVISSAVSARMVMGRFYSDTDNFYYTGSIADAMIHSPALPESMFKSLADPCNYNLSLGPCDPGWIVPDVVYPVYLPSGSAPAAAKPALWMGVCM